MYPRVIIDLKKYRSNLKYLLNTCHNNGMSVMGVSKVFCADHKLINIMIEEEIDYIADSRIQNLIGLITDIPKVLLRLPMHGEVEQVVLHSQISLNSELSTIKLLNDAAATHDIKHGVIIMIDLGDLREGIFDKNEVFSTIDEVLKLDYVIETIRKLFKYNDIII